jgi:hypothetical protein
MAVQEEDVEVLQQRDLSKTEDSSLLRFLVDMRGEDSSTKQVGSCCSFSSTL